MCVKSFYPSAGDTTSLFKTQKYQNLRKMGFIIVWKGPFKFEVFDGNFYSFKHKPVERYAR